MITTAIINAIWGIVSPIIERIPAINIPAAAISESTVYQFLQAGMYMLPINTVTTILGIVVGLWVLRVIIAVLHSLWDALPIV